MAAMMPSGTGNQSANPYEQYDAPVEDDLIDPDDGELQQVSINKCFCVDIYYKPPSTNSTTQ